MRVCVVGGSGNISVPIVKLLLRQGHDVTCFNRGNTPGMPQGAKQIIGDRADEKAFEARIQAEKFDAGIHMICYNAEQAASAIRAFRGPHLKHFIHCSTVCTYGVKYDWFPTTEDHPLRPISDYGRNKVAADETFLNAFRGDGFPVTIIKPSTTFGPKMGVLRQIAWEFGWVDRVRKGKPIAVCGDGLALHQFLHVDDAAPAFVFPLGRSRCVGKIYNMTKRGFTTWVDYHKAAMKVLGREVDLVGVPMQTLVDAKVPAVEVCRDIFAHSTYYSPDALMRDVPEFAPKISLEDGLSRVIDALDEAGRIPDSDTLDWEDTLIAAQRRVGELKLS
jgi:nucleoside-diphosphate-sugar epimerase